LAAIFWLCNQHNVKHREPYMEQSQPCCLSKSSLVSYDDGHKMMTLMCMTLWDRRARYVKHTGMFSPDSKIHLLAYLFVFLHEWSLVSIKLNYVFWWIKNHMGYVYNYLMYDNIGHWIWPISVSLDDSPDMEKVMHWSIYIKAW
jgi:hypothetical protein